MVYCSIGVRKIEEDMIPLNVVEDMGEIKKINDIEVKIFQQGDSYEVSPISV